jgi:hypothetical protein
MLDALDVLGLEKNSRLVAMVQSDLEAVHEQV